MRISAHAVWLSIALAGLLGCGSNKKGIRTVQLGEKAEIGPFIYRASETQWPMSLEGRTVKDRVFLIRISVVNAGSTDTTIPGFEIVDDAGNSYPEDLDGTGVQNWLGVSRKLSHDQTDQGNIVFDVAPRHYRLRVADDNDNFMYIDIPLNLTSENPENKKLPETSR